eukprot:ANDGO_08317.mRNA.1 hypothetical protein
MASLLDVEKLQAERDKLLRFVVSTSSFIPISANLDEINWSQVPVDPILDKVSNFADVDLGPFLPAAERETLKVSSSATDSPTSPNADIRDSVLSKLCAGDDPSSSSSSSAPAKLEDGVPPIKDLGIDDSDLVVFAYEAFLCKSRFLHLLLQDQLDAFLMVVRPACDISARLHGKVLRELLMNAQTDSVFTTFEVNALKAWKELSALSSKKGFAVPAYFEIASKNPIDYFRLLDEERKEKTHERLTAYGDDNYVVFCMFAKMLQVCCATTEFIDNQNQRDATRDALQVLCPSEEYYHVAWLLALAEATRDNLDFASHLLPHLERLSKNRTVLNFTYTSVVFARIQRMVYSLMSDYTANFALDPSVLSVFLDIFSFVCPKDVEAHVKRFITLTMNRILDRIIHDMTDPIQEERPVEGAEETDGPQTKLVTVNVKTSVTALLNEVKKELDSNRQYFYPLMKHFLAQDARWPERSMLRSVLRFVQSAESKSRLSPITVFDVSTMFMSELQLLSSGPVDFTSPPDVEDVFKIDQYHDMIVTSMNEKQLRLVEIMQNAFSYDMFDPRAQLPKHPTTSIVDLLTAINQNKLPSLPRRFQLLWNRIIGQLVQLYCTTLVQEFSRDVAEELLPKPPPILKFKLRLPAANQPLRASFMGAIPLESIILRINNLQFAVDQITEDNGAEFFFAPEGKEVQHVIETLIDGQRSMCEYLGLRVAFVELAPTLLDGLYIGGAKGQTLGVSLRKLDPLLGKICDIAHENVVDDIIFGLLRGILRALEFVVLHGGVQRIFDHVTFVPVFLNDLTLLEQFFYAGGDGLDLNQVTVQTKRLKDMANNFISMETSALISRYQRAKNQDEKDTCVLILAHRPTEDAAAFQFIREYINKARKGQQA